MTSREIATTTAKAWTLIENEGAKYALLTVTQLEALILLATGFIDDDGLIDEAISAICDRVGPDKARQLCGVE
jgi:hypothetical protein